MCIRDSTILDQSAEKIVETAKSTGAKVAGPVPLRAVSELEPEPFSFSNTDDKFTFNVVVR